MTPQEVGRMTPAEVSLYVNEYSKTLHDLAVLSGWLSASLSRSKRIPPINRFLARKSEKPTVYKTKEQLKAEFEELKRRFGVM